jgi:hypothetical protein
MRFLVDECTGTKVARWLKKEGYEVLSVYEEARGITDEAIINQAFADRSDRSPVLFNLIPILDENVLNKLRSLCAFVSLREIIFISSFIE